MRGRGITYLSFFLLAPMTDLVPLGQINSILSLPLMVCARETVISTCSSVESSLSRAVELVTEIEQREKGDIGS